MSNSHSSVQIRRRIFFCLFWLLLLLIIPVIEASTCLSPDSGNQDPQLPEPLKVYHLTVLPEIAYQKIKLNPPVTKAIITIQPGDVAIRCGYNFNIYTCISGKPLEIRAEQDNPIQEFWVQNPLPHNMRLTIFVYEYYQGSLKSS
ncbi:MAG: hypothetical protein QNJ63_03770 [Calothrix sp. MO_192.B10]|nr:hypothetical protein [Calothrix sp. MO_192.B10]